MCRALGVEGDPRIATIVERMQHRELTGQIMQRCYGAAATLTTADAIGRLEAEQVPCGVVIAPRDLAADPHARAIELLVDSESPAVGRLRQPRHPAQFGAVRPPLGGPAPTLGQHTDDVLRELGYGDRVAELRAAAVIG
jgi:crotonobetainyl-CoA:carnitine CoA-transferase CaiB-like acyl-CoA transferase